MGIKITRIPCLGCVLMAVCRYKTYEKMVEDCSLVKSILYKQNDDYPTISRGSRTREFKSVVLKIQDIVKPVKWKTTIHYGGFTIVNKEIEPWKKPKTFKVNA